MYHDAQGREIEDLEMDNIRRDRAIKAAMSHVCPICGEEIGRAKLDEFCKACHAEEQAAELHYGD